tara:strand:- start:14 stop:292 length:279 start_codon:yes stop_codon:yes gene_type:complete
MSEVIPVDFEAKAKSGGTSAMGGYPYQLSARDLMRNFVFATLEVESAYIEQTTGMNGYPTRKLKIFPPIPASGTYVLGSVNGSLSWVSTEVC